MTGRNWWKIAFFVTLFIIECMREIIVASAAQGPIPLAAANVFSFGDYTTAEGSWKRLNKGEALVPNVVHIECDRKASICKEISVTFMNEYIPAPVIDTFDAEFTDSGISYENNNPTCARYSVRIDLKLKKVFSTRDLKKNPTNKLCKNMERRLENELADGPQTYGYVDPAEKHFLPIYSILAAIF